MSDTSQVPAVRFTRPVSCTRRWAGEQRAPIAWEIPLGEVLGVGCCLLMRTEGGRVDLRMRSADGIEVFEGIPADSFEVVS